MSGYRYNKGKGSLNLLPLDALREICKVYDFGASKYAPWNWAKGLSYSETQASLMRHLTDWSIGVDKDTESGLYHDVHIAWNAITLVALRIRGIGTDDRFKLSGSKADSSLDTTSTLTDTVTVVAAKDNPVTVTCSACNDTYVVGPDDNGTNAGDSRTTVVKPMPSTVVVPVSDT